MNMWFICLLKLYAYHLNVRERESVFYLLVEAVCIPFKYESVNMWLICLLKLYAYHLNMREREYVFYLLVEAVCIPFKCERA